ncbi:MAG: M23 family metallopeptidase [Deltaproteobacteria bacterium]|nr:M23 family metallopeptidase [Deltaproteobacteria bacterium]
MGLPKGIKKRGWSNKRIFLLAGILGAAFIRWAMLPAPSLPPPDPLPREEETFLPEKPGTVLSGRLAKNRTLSYTLRSLGLIPELVEAICRQIGGLVDPRRMKPGETFEVRLGPTGKFLEFIYQASPIHVYRLAPGPAGEWIRERKEIPVDKFWAKLEGQITSSLFAAIASLGEMDSLVLDFAEIFAWDIDFHSEPQPGDRFRLVVEKYYANEDFIQYGRILFAEYESSSGLRRAVYFEPSASRGEYFTPQGKALRLPFLRSPLKFTRLSSGYSRSRLHPILGIRRPHYGVDYAAPAGSPVWAIADGWVISAGWRGGFGKQVVLKHAGGYRSMYNHLSRTAPGIRPGKRVSQKEVIGYVGSTGLSTGPHLDFRLLKDGTYRNPLREIPPHRQSLPEDEWGRFQQVAGELMEWNQDPGRSDLVKVASLNSSYSIFDAFPRSEAK